MEIYRRLCNDLRRKVGSYFRLYERMGLVSGQVSRFHDPECREAYYLRIRKCPGGFRSSWLRTEFYYRKHAYRFQWCVSVVGHFLNGMDRWCVRVWSQWEQPRHTDRDVYNQLVMHMTHHAPSFFREKLETTHSSPICGEVSFLIDPLEIGRQGVLYRFAPLIGQLSKQAEMTQKRMCTD